MAEYREAIPLKPDHAEAHCNLGLILLYLGRPAEALEELHQGHELGSRRPGWSNPSARWVTECEQRVALELRLSAVLKGDSRPRDAAEGLALAQLCDDKDLHNAAVRLWADAFASAPEGAEDRQNWARYNAACSAVLAASGRAGDGPPPDEAARADLRGKALGWLKAELITWAKLLESGKDEDRAAVRKMTRHWLNDVELAGLQRDGIPRQAPRSRAEGVVRTLGRCRNPQEASRRADPLNDTNDSSWPGDRPARAGGHFHCRLARDFMRSAFRRCPACLSMSRT